MTPFEIALLVVALPPFVVLVLTLANVLFVWPRGVTQARVPGSLSVLIPADDAEAVDIERCVRAIFANEHPIDEVIIQHTHPAAVLQGRIAALQAEFPQVRLLRVPDGVEPSCEQLVAHASGEVLLFVDVGVQLAHAGIARIGSLMLLREADLIGLAPAEHKFTFVARQLLPFKRLLAVALFPAGFARRGRRVARWLASPCGTLIAARRSALAAGRTALRHPWPSLTEWGDEAEARGLHVVLGDGDLVATYERDHTPQGVWRSLERGLQKATSQRPLALGALLLFVAWCFVLPYGMLALAVVPGGLDPAWALWPALLGVAANVALRLVLLLRYRHPLEGLLLHPLAALALMAVLVQGTARTLVSHAKRTLKRSKRNPLHPSTGRASQHN